MNRLKPCPFCGGEAKILKADAPEDINRSEYIHVVECQSCYIRALHYRMQEQAMSAWNKRSSKIDNNSTLADMTRCSDCKNWDKSISFMGAHACAFWSNSKTNPRYTQEFDFCSFAEPKKENENAEIY